MSSVSANMVLISHSRLCTSTRQGVSAPRPRRMQRETTSLDFRTTKSHRDSDSLGVTLPLPGHSVRKAPSGERRGRTNLAETKPPSGGSRERWSGSQRRSPAGGVAIAGAPYGGQEPRVWTCPRSASASTSKAGLVVEPTFTATWRD